MTIVIWIATALLVAWVMLSWLPAGVDGRVPVPYLIALQPFLAIPTAALLALTLWIEPTLAPLQGLILAWTFMPGLRYRFQRAQRHTQPTAERRATIRVMTLNCRYGRADADAIARAARKHHIDVLALQELTSELLDQLTAAGLHDLLPYSSIGMDKPDDNGGFNGVFSAQEPAATTRNAVPAMPAADVPTLTVGGVTFASAHPKSPMRGCRAWSDGIRALAKLGNKAFSPAVILGDLNSNINHPSFRALLRDGNLRDADQERPLFLSLPRPTFPRWTKWPRITLDHALVTADLEAQVVETLEIPGTDHLALIVTVTRA